MEETQNDIQARVYELGFLLTPTIADTEVPEVVARFSAAVETLGGTILADGTPEYIDLAYQMEQRIGGKILKWTQAHFGWIKFDLDPAQTEALKKVLDLDQALIRYLLIKTTVENTTIFKKPKLEVKRGQEKEEEIDEEALIAETEALEASGELDAVDTAEEGSDLAHHEKLPDLRADIAEGETV